jgi:hypothetical protein
MKQVSTATEWKKAEVVILNYIKLSGKQKSNIIKVFSNEPYITTFKPYVYTEDSNECSDRSHKLATAVSSELITIRADVTELKQEVAALKGAIKEIMSEFKADMLTELKQMLVANTAAASNNKSQSLPATPSAAASIVF